jgi:hypothetical protein
MYEDEVGKKKSILQIISNKKNGNQIQELKN